MLYTCKISKGYKEGALGGFEFTKYALLAMSQHTHWTRKITMLQKVSEDDQKISSPTAGQPTAK